MILLDNDHFTVMAHENYSQHRGLAVRLRAAVEEVCLPVIAVEESLRGWLAQVHQAKRESQRIAAYDHLIELLGVVPQLRIIRWDGDAAREFARQRALRVNISPHDLMIATLAITHGALLLTRNAKDFSRVFGLRFESWLD